MQLIDQEIFDSLVQTFSDDGDELKDIFRLFFQESAKRIEELETAFNEGNLEKVQKLAHSLKGSAANYSAASLASIASTMEKSPSLAGIAALRTTLDKVKIAIDSLIYPPQ